MRGFSETISLYNHLFIRFNSLKLMNKLIQYLALFLLLLVTGVYWGPWLGLHRSLDAFSPAELIHLSQVLAQNLGGSMGLLLPACIGLLALSAWGYPDKRSKNFYLILLSIGFVIASLGISVGIEKPIVDQMKVWTDTTVPADWGQLRDKWVYFTVVRMLTGLLAFLLFSAAVMRPVRAKANELRGKSILS